MINSKLISIIIIIFIYCFSHFSVYAVIAPSQKALAINIIKSCSLSYSNQEITDPCNNPPGFIKCRDTINVDDITINFDADDNTPESCSQVLGDLRVFTNLNNIDLRGLNSLNSQFFETMDQLDNLKYLNVDFQWLPMSTTTRLPNTLSILSFGLLNQTMGKNFFQGKGLSKLTVKNSAKGCSYPSELDVVNNNLMILSLGVNQYATPPSNLLDKLQGLTDLTLIVDNEMSKDGYQNFSFPTLTGGNSLKLLSIQFSNYNQSTTLQLFEFPTTLAQLNIPTLSIYGRGFTVPSIGFIDLSNSTFSLSIYGTCEMIDQCNSNDCIRMPPNLGLSIRACSFDFKRFNFNKPGINFINSGNYYLQTLPALDYKSLTNFDVDSSFIYGDIPNEACLSKKSAFKVTNTLLNGSVPNCFRCIGGSLCNNIILPNQFKDFDKNTLSTCPAFQWFNNYTKLIDTKGGTFSIYGSNLGWSSIVNGTDTTLAYPNQRLDLNIAPGVGVDKKVSVIFNQINSENALFNYSYIPPTIKYMKFKTINGTQYLAIAGSGFDYTSSNIVTINGKEFEMGSPDQDYDLVYTSDAQYVSSLSNGDQLDIGMVVGGQDSGISTFFVYKSSISISDPNIKFRSSGGTININGTFGVNDKKYARVYVNDNSCIANSISPSQISITYPKSTQLGNFNLTINIGGSEDSTIIEYIKSDNNNQNSSSDNNNSNNSNNNSGSSDSDDSVSNSTKSIISFYLLLILLIVNL